MIKNIARPSLLLNKTMLNNKPTIKHSKMPTPQISSNPFPLPRTALINCNRIKIVSKICISEINMEVLIHLLSMPFSLQKPLQATIKPTWLQSLPSRILQTTHILEVVIFHNKKSPTINLNKKCNPLLIIYQTNYKIMRINRREIWSRISLTIQLQIRSPHLTVNQWRSPFRKMTKVTILKRGPIMKPSLRGKIMHHFLLMSTHPNPQLFLQNHQNRFQVGQPFDWVSVV